jgi:hypothetical protein
MAQLSTQEIRTHSLSGSISLLGEKACDELSKLIASIYARLTQIGFVKMNLQKFELLFQALLQTFEMSRIQTYKKVSRWAFSPTVYNQLMELWLLQNLPFASRVKPYENFVSALHTLNKKSRNEADNALIQSFHDMASAEWLSLQTPTVQELFNSLLRAVAKVMNKQLGFEDQVFSQVLYGNLQLEAEDLVEFSNQKRFIDNVWEQLDEAHRSKGQELIQEATKEYFNSAKRFILINHPSRISERNLLVLLRGFLQDKTLACRDLPLNLVEQGLDKLMKFANAGYPGPKEASNLFQRGEIILRKILVLSLLPVKYSSEIALGFRESKPYIAADQYLNLTEKLENAIYYSMWSYDILKTKAVCPTYDYVTLKVNKTRTTVTATLQGLNKKLVKKNIKRLSKQYEVLNRARLVIGENLTRLVFDKNAIREFGADLKTQVLEIYQNLKNLEVEKLKATGTQYYKWLLNKYKNIQQNDDKLENQQVLIQQTEIIRQVEFEERKEEIQAEVKVEEEEPKSEAEQASTEGSTRRQEDLHEDLNVRDISSGEIDSEPKMVEQNDEETNQETQKKKKGKGKNKKN